MEAEEEKVEEFYGQIESAIRSSPSSDIKIVVGDWNAKIGRESKGCSHVMGSHGIGERNRRGEWLLHLALANTKTPGKWTWQTLETLEIFTGAEVSQEQTSGLITNWCCTTYSVVSTLQSNQMEQKEEGIIERSQNNQK